MVSLKETVSVLNPDKENEDNTVRLGPTLIMEVGRSPESILLVNALFSTWAQNKKEGQIAEEWKEEVRSHLGELNLMQKN